MVEGIVPKIPPTFVPNFSASMVMIMTISAERMKGKTDCSKISIMKRALHYSIKRLFKKELNQLEIYLPW